MAEPILLVMAAGMGSRYGGLKQIDKITDEGEIILDFSLYDAWKAGFKKAVFIIKEENLNDFKDILDDGAGRYLEIEYVFQRIDDLPPGYEQLHGRKKPWGTGHAIMTARNVINSPFAVINADDYYGKEAFKEMYEFLSEIGTDDRKVLPFSMVAYEIKNTISENGAVSRGICDVDDRGYLEHIVERHNIERKGEKIIFELDGKEFPLDDDTKVSMNFWGYTEDIMDELAIRFPTFLDRALEGDPMKDEYLIPEVTDDLIKSGKATCLCLDSGDKWHGVTYREDKETVKKAVEQRKQRGEYPQKLWQNP